MKAVSLCTTVLLADDHRMLSEGLKRMLDAVSDISVVAEAASGHEALERLRTQPVDVAVLDLSMPGLSGVDLIRRVKSEFPDVGVLVLTMHDEQQYAVRAFRAGANGYLTKDCAAEELVNAIRKVASGGSYVSSALAELLAVGLNNSRREEQPHMRLSDREFEVLRHIVLGRRLSDIADLLHLSVKTVSTHKTRILEKMQLDSTAALVKYCVKHHLFDDTEIGNPADAADS